MPTQSQKTIALGSGTEGSERESRYMKAASLAGKNLSEWIRDSLDKEASKILAKVDQKA